MPFNTIYVGRGSRWGNPYKVGKDGTAQECIQKYINDLLPYSHRGPRNTLADFHISIANIDDIRRSLKGKDLACWCSPESPCHADFLLNIANEESIID